ncbi:hypothetical protein ACHAXR_009990 [Thalassiosira sp. AJA248-18]
MIFPNISFLALGITMYANQARAADECTSIESITCVPTTTTSPTLDASTADWSSVDTFETPLTGALTSQLYAHGNVKIQCVHDASRVYFLFQVPGRYRFDTEDNHKCASISTMFQMGDQATLFNMGGCPLAEAYNCDAAPEGCEAYKVDIGGHWELRTTSREVTYDVNEKTGDDGIANKDDEYAVSPYCRFDDDDVNAANEWAAAWNHDSPLDGADGVYIFEMSRLLKTASTETDAQLDGGKEIGFGFSYWDPFENADSGWSDAGHFVTGCSTDWIALRLVDENGLTPDELADTTSSTPPPSDQSAATFVGPMTLSVSAMTALTLAAYML